MEDVYARLRFSFSLYKLRYSPLQFNSRKMRQHLTSGTRWSKSDKVWNNANSRFLKWRFRGRRLRCCSLFGGTEKEQIGMVRAVEFYCSLMRQSLEHTVFSRVQSVAALQREHRCKVGRRPVKAHYGAESVSLFVSSRHPDQWRHRSDRIIVTGSFTSSQINWCWHLKTKKTLRTWF